MSSWNKHNPNNPFECCHGCPDRYQACSDKCERYQEAVKIRAEQRRQERLEAALGRAEKIRPIKNAKKK